MNENHRNDDLNDQKSNDQDQLRDNTMNETIRAVSGNEDADLNKMTDAGLDTDSSNGGATATTGNKDNTSGGANYTPEDPSAVRSGGIIDMNDQTVSGAGSGITHRRGSGSGLAPKTGTTGSDYDGQSAS